MDERVEGHDVRRHAVRPHAAAQLRRVGGQARTPVGREEDVEDSDVRAAARQQHGVKHTQGILVLALPAAQERKWGERVVVRNVTLEHKQ